MLTHSTVRFLSFIGLVHDRITRRPEGPIASAGSAVLLGVLAVGAGQGCGPAPSESAVAAAPKRAARQYELRITSTPPACEVTIDGQPAGTTPLTRRFDTPAAIVAEISAPGHTPTVFRTDARWWHKSAAAKAARQFNLPVVVREVRVAPKPRVQLQIESDPPGATVTINGKAIGRTPTHTEWDGRRKLTVRLRRKGYDVYRKTLDRQWWETHGGQAKLDTAYDVQITPLTASLRPASSRRWTRLDANSTGQSGPAAGPTNYRPTGRSRFIGQMAVIAGPTLEGSRFDIKRYRGKVVLVDFWASWCGPCRREMPKVLEAYNRYRRDGFEVVGVNFDRTRKALADYVRDEKLPWPQVFFDREGSKGFDNPLGRRYEVTAIPFTLLVGRDGRIIDADLRGAALERAVAAALGR